LKSALSPFSARIHAAFVYGSIARGEESAASDIDLLVIADDLEYSEIFSAIPAVGALLARPVSPNLMTRKEWRRKRADPDSFAGRIAAQPKLFVMGTENELE
jgi:predicted nucleotidyltransferase